MGLEWEEEDGKQMPALAREPALALAPEPEPALALDVHGGHEPVAAGVTAQPVFQQPEYLFPALVRVRLEGISASYR